MCDAKGNDRQISAAPDHVIVRCQCGRALKANHADIGRTAKCAVCGSPVMIQATAPVSEQTKSRTIPTFDSVISGNGADQSQPGRPIPPPPPSLATADGRRVTPPSSLLHRTVSQSFASSAPTSADNPSVDPSPFHASVSTESSPPDKSSEGWSHWLGAAAFATYGAYRIYQNRTALSWVKENFISTLACLIGFVVLCLFAAGLLRRYPWLKDAFRVVVVLLIVILLACAVVFSWTCLEHERQFG